MLGKKLIVMAIAWIGVGAPILAQEASSEELLAVVAHALQRNDLCSFEICLPCQGNADQYKAVFMCKERHEEHCHGKHNHQTTKINCFNEEQLRQIKAIVSEAQEKGLSTDQNDDGIFQKLGLSLCKKCISSLEEIVPEEPEPVLQKTAPSYAPIVKYAVNRCGALVVSVAVSATPLLFAYVYTWLTGDCGSYCQI